MSNTKVLRHSLTVRLNHWLIALSSLVLIFSGMGELPMYKRYFINKLPGLGWASDFWLQLDIHYVAASVFMASVFFHLIYHLRRREFEIIPKKGDLRESIEIIIAMVRGKKEPPHGKFLAEQRLAYAAIGTTTLVLIVTGMIKAFKNLGPIMIDPGLLGIITLAHTAFTMLFVFLIISHLGAFIIKANLPLLPSMFHGKVDRKYAKERHCHWDCEPEK